MRILIQRVSLKFLWVCFYHGIFFHCRTILFSLVLALSPVVYAVDYFNPDSLEQNEFFNVDLSYFERPDGQLPGTYNVEIYINERYFGARNIHFLINSEGQLYPQIPISLLDKMDVDISTIPVLAEQSKSSYITRISECIPGATSHFDFSSQHLHLFIPDKVIRKEESLGHLKIMILNIIDNLGIL